MHVFFIPCKKKLKFLRQNTSSSYLTFRSPSLGLLKNAPGYSTAPSGLPVSDAFKLSFLSAVECRLDKEFER